MTLSLIYILKCNSACAVHYASHTSSQPMKRQAMMMEKTKLLLKNYIYESWEKLVVERLEGGREGVKEEEEECGFFHNNNRS